jgi:hypothetical protein
LFFHSGILLLIAKTITDLLTAQNIMAEAKYMCAQGAVFVFIHPCERRINNVELRNIHANNICLNVFYIFPRIQLKVAIEFESIC